MHDIQVKATYHRICNTLKPCSFLPIPFKMILNLISWGISAFKSSVHTYPTINCRLKILSTCRSESDCGLIKSTFWISHTEIWNWNNPTIVLIKSGKTIYVNKVGQTIKVDKSQVINLMSSYLVLRAWLKNIENCYTHKL